LIRPSIDSYNVVDAMPDERPQVKYPRTPGYRPQGRENPYNAWYYKTSVKGAAWGKLRDKTIALKDNVMLAGVPMMNGASTLEGYVPDVDATIVTRILDAGGEIVGKAHCEYFCLSGGSHTNATGPVHNPHKRGYSAGGSSSGSAALVAAGEADMAIGGDQGGSIRIPASFCGIYGMKPTHGLVPYTGIMPIESFVDDAGPMTANVRDNALLLEVLAGPDGYDPRQYNVKTQPYTRLLEGGVQGLSITLVREGFGHVNAEPDVDASVRAAAEQFKRLGAAVDDVSIPMHLLGSRYYGKAMNITRRLTAAYDQVLATYDLLLMPTLPLKATPLPAPDAPREVDVQRALKMIANTAPFDLTHHPAMSVPCSLRDGLPVGMMLVGKHFDEASIYRAAYAFEQSVDWRSL
jgi:amidase